MYSHLSCSQYYVIKNNAEMNAHVLSYYWKYILGYIPMSGVAGSKECKCSFVRYLLPSSPPIGLYQFAFSPAMCCHPF